jgi:hypothetical protein
VTFPFHQQPAVGISIFEKLPHWGPELKRQFASESVLVRECRSIHDLLPTAQQFRQSVAILVVDAAPEDCLNWMSTQVQSDWNLCVVTIASKEFAELEWVLREAGVTAFVDDEIAGHRLASLCRRLLRRESNVVSQ